MFQEWRSCELGDVVTLKRGYDLPKKKRVCGSVPIVSSSGVSGFHNEAKLDPPGVVTGRYGTLGEVFYLESAYWPLNTTLYVRNFKENHPRFISYFLKTLDFESLSAAAAVPGLNRNHLHLLPVRIPSVSTQRKIAVILSTYDDLIENNLRRIKILEEMAQNLYREWFVKFRFPGHEQVRMVDSPLGKIPEGWELGRLDDLVVLQRGFDLPKKKRQPGHTIVYAAAGPHGFHDEAKVTGPGVVAGRSGTIGVVRYVEKDFWPLNTTLWIKQFKQCTPLFAFYLLSDIDFQQFRSGAAVPTLNRNHVHGLPVVIPPEELIRDFQSIAEPMNRLVNSLREKNETLRQTRDLLLPKLISGELDVSELDIATGKKAA